MRSSSTAVELLRIAAVELLRALAGQVALRGPSGRAATPAQAARLTRPARGPCTLRARGKSEFPMRPGRPEHCGQPGLGRPWLRDLHNLKRRAPADSEGALGPGDQWHWGLAGARGPLRVDGEREAHEVERHWQPEFADSEKSLLAPKSLLPLNHAVTTVSSMSHSNREVGRRLESLKGRYTERAASSPSAPV